MTGSRSLVLFWVEDMPPTQGGIQKRLSCFVEECSKYHRVILVQKGGHRQFAKKVQTITIDPDNFVMDSWRVINQELMIGPEQEKFVYVSKIFEFETPFHLTALQDISFRATKVILRLASTRSAEFIHKYRSDFSLHSLRIHCLNKYSYQKVSKWHGDTFLFNNFSPDPGYFELNDSAFNYAFCGRIVESKNVTSLLSAWRKFKLNNKSLKIWGSYKATYFNEYIRNKIEDDKTISYCGKYPIGDPTPFISSTHIVTPSLREGSSNLIIEAMSYGRVIIASRIPGIEDLLPYGYPLFIESPFGPEEVLDSLKKSADLNFCRNTTQKLSKELRTHYLNCFSIDVELEELLAQFMNQNRRELLSVNYLHKRFHPSLSPK